MHFVEDLSDSMHQERPSDGFLFELVLRFLFFGMCSPGRLPSVIKLSTWNWLLDVLNRLERCTYISSYALAFDVINWVEKLVLLLRCSVMLSVGS